MQRIQISRADVDDPERLRQRLDRAYDDIFTLLQQQRLLRDEIDQVRGGGLTENDRLLLKQLSIGSTASAAPPQVALVPLVDSLPPVAISTDGEVKKLSTDGKLYRFNGAIQTWEEFTIGSHNLLSATHPDTLAASAVRGDLITGNSTPKWARFAKGAALLHLRMNAGATDIEWAAIADAELSANIARLNNAGILQTFLDAITFSSDIIANGYLMANGGAGFHVRGVASGTSTLTRADNFVSVDVSGGIATVKFEASPATNSFHLLVDDQQNAAANNITIDGNGKNLNGSATRAMNVNGQVALYFYNNSQWTGKIF